MFFVASKIAGILVFHPLNFLLFLGLFGLLLGLTRAERAGRFVALLAAVLLLVAAFSPISALILRPLEDRFPQPPADAPTPDGIVVLGGALDEDLGRARGQPTLTEAAARLTSGVALALRYPQARLVFTGGSANLDASAAADEASGVRALWLSLGLPAQRMTFEGPFAQHLRERDDDPRPGPAQARRALVARHLGGAHAALDRHLSPCRVEHDRLSRGLSHLRRRSRRQADDAGA